MGQKPWNLSDREASARKHLECELRDHLALTLDAFNLIGEAANLLPKRPLECVPRSTKVACNLLVRWSNDLRACALLAAWGYHIQALSTVASMYETAYAVAFIAADDDLAQQWIDHEDPTRAFCDVKTLTREALQKEGHPAPDSQCRIEYRVYSQLCLAKHANPLLQKEHGHRIIHDLIVAENGPATSDEAVRASWFALEHGAALACLAAASFIRNHLPADKTSELADRLREIGSRRKALAAKAAARWGTDDPFPGKWRL